MSELAGASTVCVIRPGDRVLIGLREPQLTQAVAAQIKAGLESQFPDVEFFLLLGVTCMAVQRSEADQ